jgi:adenylate cyclase
MAAPTRSGFLVGFKTSIITLFVGTVLFVGLTLVYLSFERATAITRSAASSYLDTVAELSAARIDTQFNTVRDNIDVLRGIPSVQSAAIGSSSLHALLAAMLRNNKQLYSLYIGYDDGSFVELDFIERAAPSSRIRVGAPEGAQFRLVVISRSDWGKGVAATTSYLSDALAPIAVTPGPIDYDPRERPWYKGAYEADAHLLTDPYIFFSTGEPGYTLRMPIQEGHRGVVAGDIFLSEAEAMLRKQQLGRSGLVFLFDDAGRVLVHPELSKFVAEGSEQGQFGQLPSLEAVDKIGLSRAISAWRRSGKAQQFFRDGHGRAYAAAFRSVETAGSANLRLGVFAPLDEFFAEIEAERRSLFLLALGFVLATVPLVFWIGSKMSERLKLLALETDSIQRFELKDTPQLRSVIREIHELGRSVSTMRTLVQTFSSFIPKRLVQQLMETGTAMKLGGTRREVTILFTDVVNFSGITENADPTDVMLYTSRYFTAMSDAIMAARGTVDKFVGDAVMAIWNAPVDDPDHVANGCAAVLACIEANSELNREFEREGWPVYHTRFGLHVGDAVVGNIGSPDRMNYTVLGAAVNLSARLESLNKGYGTTALVSEAVKTRAEGRFVFRSIDRVKPKGFAAEFPVFELCCERTPDNEATAARAADWETIYPAMSDPGSSRSLVLLDAFLARYPDDRIALHYRKRIGGVMEGGGILVPPNATPRLRSL